MTLNVTVSVTSRQRRRAAPQAHTDARRFHVEAGVTSSSCSEADSELRRVNLKTSISALTTRFDLVSSQLSPLTNPHHHRRHTYTSADTATPHDATPKVPQLPYQGHTTPHQATPQCATIRYDTTRHNAGEIAPRIIIASPPFLPLGAADVRPCPAHMAWETPHFWFPDAE